MKDEPMPEKDRIVARYVVGEVINYLLEHNEAQHILSFLDSLIMPVQTSSRSKKRKQKD